MSIEQNIKDRELFEMIEAEAGPKFWELCHLKLFPAVADEIESDCMTRAEVARFEQTKIGFGMHAGKCIEDIPIDYLEFLANSQGFYKQLNRYLKTTT